jgi:hypothetical protein
VGQKRQKINHRLSRAKKRVVVSFSERQALTLSPPCLRA